MCAATQIAMSMGKVNGIQNPGHKFLDAIISEVAARCAFLLAFNVAMKIAAMNAVSLLDNHNIL